MVAGQDDAARALGARLRLALPPTHVLETDRLLLREQTLADAPALLAILGDALTMSFYRRPFTPAEVEAWIERNRRSYAERGHGLWALVRKDDGSFVGQCGLLPQSVEGAEEIEIGWHVDRRLWRRGYASEAAAASRDYGFGELALERLISLVRPENVASGGVAHKIGMEPERSIVYKGLPHIVYSITNARA